MFPHHIDPAFKLPIFVSPMLGLFELTSLAVLSVVAILDFLVMEESVEQIGPGDDCQYHIGFQLEAGVRLLKSARRKGPLLDLL